MARWKSKVKIYRSRDTVASLNMCLLWSAVLVARGGFYSKLQMWTSWWCHKTIHRMTTVSRIHLVCTKSHCALSNYPKSLCGRMQSPHDGRLLNWSAALLIVTNCLGSCALSSADIYMLWKVKCQHSSLHFYWYWWWWVWTVLK